MVVSPLIAKEGRHELSDEIRIPTNLRTLLILEIVGKADRALTPTEINVHLQLPKQTVHRLCTTLMEEGFLIKDVQGKGLRPARRLRGLATGILQASHYHLARHQILIEIAEEVGETVNYVMPEEGGMNYVDRVETDWAFRVQLPIGTHVPFHCTASGKTFLASMTKRAREHHISAIGLKQLTHNTIATPEDLLHELETIAKQGYAIDNEEFMDGMVACAVPILDDQNRFVAALAFHGPSIRITLDDLHSKKDILIAGAQKLSRILLDDD